MLSYLLVMVGLLICGAVVFQLAVTVAGSLGHFRSNRQQNELSISLLKSQIQATGLLHRERTDVSELSWNGYRKFVVKKLVRENGSAASVYLAPHDGKKLPPFRPGQYLTFNLRIPGVLKPVIRCYSLSDRHDSETYRISVKKVPPPPKRPELPPGLSSSYVNDVLKEGDILDVKAPSGAFTLEVHENFPIVLIAGGIGITPLYSMLRAVLATGTQREVWMFYGLRKKDEHVFKNDLDEIARTNANVKIITAYSEPTPTCKEGSDFQHKGYVSLDLLKKFLPGNNYSFYLCGPPPMMESLSTTLGEWGVPETRVHYEAFGPATVKKTANRKGDETTAAPAVASSNIKFAQSGKTIAWDPNKLSILELARANGLTMNSGCCVGQCGTCLVAIKSGEVSYVSKPGYEVEAGSCLLCIAVPKGNLELDA